MPLALSSRPVLAPALALLALLANDVACSVSHMRPEAACASGGIYRARLGAFTVVALSDGTTDLDTDELMIDAEPGGVKRLLGQANLPTKVATSVNAYLVDTGKKRILFDAGTGSLFGPTLGKLPSRLEEAGYPPERIDEIYITHLHGDHFGGLAIDGKSVFANAHVHVDEREMAFWSDRSNLSRVDDTVKISFDAAPASLAPYVAAGRVKTFAAGAELEPGVRSVASTGHTAGHTTFWIESQGKTMIVCGDTVHLAAAQLPDPRITIRYDTTPAEAAVARQRLFAEAEARGYWLAASHIAFPGIGRLASERAGFAWRPAREGDLR